MYSMYTVHEGLESIRVEACAHLVNLNQWITDGLRTKRKDGSTNVALKKRLLGAISRVLLLPWYQDTDGG